MLWRRRGSKAGDGDVDNGSVGGGCAGMLLTVYDDRRLERRL